ncbi:MAG: hypothetical protein QOK06_2559 [Acidimicrobiaceae bacterium]
MGYTSETLSDPRDAVRELVLRPIYAGHAIRLDQAMVTRRIATAAVLLVLFGAGCASHGGMNVAAGPEAAVVLPGAPVVESTTTTATTVAAPADTTPEPAAAPTPVMNAAPTLAPATIEVDYQPLAGSTAKATIDGPNGTHSKSLDSGAALFGGLPAGTYSVIVTVDSPSGDPTVGDARVIINGGNINVGAGEHGVIVCDDSGCSGAL